MTMTVEVNEIVIEEEPSRIGWGWFLAAGIAWFVLGLSILSWNPVSISLISFTVAAVVIMAGVMELALAFAAPGWRWLHAIIGVIFLIGGFAALLQPLQTFVALAVLFGWFLVLKGMVVIITSIAVRGPGTLWGLGLFVGIIDLLIGLWAIGYPGRSAWLLVLWVGIGAIFHGIADIIHAFEVRSQR